MKGLVGLLCGATVAVALAVPAEAAPFNVAAGATVTASGTTGVMTCCWAVGPLAPLSTITDGVFLPEGSIWQTNTVWWDERHAPSLNNVIDIDLGGNYLVDRFTLQADNNDNYIVAYRDWGGSWTTLGFFPGVAGFGMTTRGVGPGWNLQASAFRIDAFGGDEFYSVSEFQAVGVPEPGVLALLGLGIAGAVRRRRGKHLDNA